MVIPGSAVTLVLRSELFRIEHASVVLVEKDFRSQLKPMQLDAVCVQNSIPDLCFKHAVAHLMWLGNVHVQRVESGQRWFISRMLLPLEVEVTQGNMHGGQIEVKLPYQDVFELRTLDRERAVQPNRTVSWYCDEISSFSQTDANGMMVLLENPTCLRLDMLPGEIFEIRRVV